MARTLKILHTEASTGWGGQEIRTLQESVWLAKRGHRIFILCPQLSGMMERGKGIDIRGVSFHPVSFKRILDPIDLLKLHRFMRAEGVDLLHTHSSIDSWSASAAARIAGVPIVRSRHVSIPIKDFFPRNLVYRFPDRIITSGQMIAEMVSGLGVVSKKNVVSIPAGVDMERFRPDIDGVAVREEFGIPLGAPLIGKVAVIRYWKGHPDFVDAAEIVLRTRPDAYFLIVGAGPGAHRVEKLIREKGLEKRVLMAGHREDVPEIIRALDLLALASTSGEATSQVIPQAWACKRCVIATAAGGIPEIVRDGVNGILTPPGDPERLAERIGFLIGNPELRERLAQAGYETVKEGLSEERMMDKTLTVYRELARQGQV